jgi:hypothetical protein
MTTFRINQLPQSTVLFLYSEREQLQTDPVYQRQSEIWSVEKKQLLIDSILNGYDLPKLYFHELPDAGDSERQFRYAIVDGKQRLSAVWDFIDNKFALSDEFEYLPDPTANLGGLTYPELAEKYPRIKIRFDSTSLPAVPLNAAERRNAFGGPIPPHIRTLSEHELFKIRLPFDNTRYRHFDLSVKFLYIEYLNGLGETKKRALDEFVKAFRRPPHSQEEADRLASGAMKRVAAMAKVFTARDELLRSTGTVVLYYNLFREGQDEGWSERITRQSLQAFEDQRRRNRTLAENESDETDLQLLEYDRLAQSSNDEHALKTRYATLRKYLGF